MKKEKVVCICSGGMDSVTLLYDLVNQGYDVNVLSFDYHQKHRKELLYAKKTCERLKLNHKIVDLKVLNQLAPSALTRDDWKVPEGKYDDKTMKQTIVPNRNMVMLSLAVSYCIGIDAKKVFYGAHSGDHHIYEDCRPEFVEAMKKSILLCDKNKVKLIAPYSNLDKGDIAIKGKKLNVDYSLTWTCYKGEKKICNVCGACTERAEAFAKAKMTDPLTN